LRPIAANGFPWGTPLPGTSRGDGEVVSHHKSKVASSGNWMPPRSPRGDPLASAHEWRTAVNRNVADSAGPNETGPEKPDSGWWSGRVQLITGLVVAASGLIGALTTLIVTVQR
jgi:hypothetical protein